MGETKNGQKMRARTFQSLLIALLIMGTAGLASASTEPPRRADVLPGLEPLDHFVDASLPWYERATAGLERARPSFVILQQRGMGMPPLSGFIIGPRHVVTAHLRELTPNHQPPSFVVRTIDGQVRNGVQVAGWQEWDFGVLELDTPLDLPPVVFGDERAMTPGDLVINIGNPTANGRSGLGLATIAAFLALVDGFVVTDISTSAGGSGGPVLTIDGELIGMQSLGVNGFSEMVDVVTLKVSELRLRNTIPFDRSAGSGGASASVIAALTEPYRR